MIDAYYWCTTNGHKLLIMLIESGLDYTLHHVDIARGDQFDPAFLAIAPNNKIPAIVDRAPADGGAPVPVFESAVILEYLAEKSGRLLPEDPRRRLEVKQWLVWQVAGLGPLGGQCLHFHEYAPEPIPYAQRRYANEVGRLYAVLDKRLAEKEYVCGTYSIADVAILPWVVPAERMQQNLDEFPNLARWFAIMRGKPAVNEAYAYADTVERTPLDTPEARRILLEQSAATVRGF